MPAPVQRLTEIRRAELIRFYREMQRIQPDMAELIEAADIIEALQVENYRYLHDSAVFMQNDAFPETVCTLDHLSGRRPLVLGGFSCVTYEEWTEFPVANAAVFAVA